MVKDVHYKKGDVIYLQGDEADSIYFVKYGTVELYIDYKMPSAKRIGTAGEGRVFGELGVIEKKPRTMTTVAMEETVVTVVDKDSLLSYINENPNKMILIMESLSSRIRSQSQKLVKACATVAEYVEEKEQNGTVDKALVEKMKTLAKENIRSKVS